MTLKLRNVRRDILPMPATTGANVRTIGTKRASTIVLAPCWSKKSSVRSMYSRLNNLESGRRNRRGPVFWPMVKPTWSPMTAAAKHPSEDGGEVQLALVGEDPGGEQERVAGQEEADEQAGLGEDDEHQPDLAVRAQVVEDLLRIQTERENGREQVHGHGAQDRRPDPTPLGTTRS